MEDVSLHRLLYERNRNYIHGHDTAQNFNGTKRNGTNSQYYIENGRAWERQRPKRVQICGVAKLKRGKNRKYWALERMNMYNFDAH